MDDSEIAISEHDREVAREALRCNPGLAKGNGPVDAVEFLAGLHQIWGPDKFLLRLGLRKPNDRIEEISVEFFQGNITDNEARQQMMAHVSRPVDEEMLRGFFDDLEQQLNRYSLFVQAILHFANNMHGKLVRNTDERKINRLVREIIAPLKMYSEEIESVFNFLEEVRVEKQMGIARIAEFSHATAAELVVAIGEFVRGIWASSCDIARKSQSDARYLYSIGSVPLYIKTSLKKLPRAQDVFALLSEEKAAARLCLRERQALATNEAIDEETETNANTILFTVTSWSDLAIGIDEKRQYWGITPAPVVGGVFEKSRAVKLPLRGKRWKTVLETLANAREPNLVPATELLKALGNFPPAAKSLSLELALADGLHALDGNVTSYLNEISKDLGRKLRSFVGGPTGKGASAFSIDVDTFISGFCVKFLFQDQSGRLRFGDSNRQ